jgi:hypothetical protein
MAIISNQKSKIPRREAYKREITLLSHGYSDPKAWPDGKLTVYPWDNELDIWIVENAKKYDSNELVYEMLKRCCNLNNGDVGNFVSTEINLVLLLSKARLENDIVSYTSVCPSCGFKAEEKIAVPDELGVSGEKKSDYPGYDDVILPDNKDVIALRPLLVNDERTIVNRPPVERNRITDASLRILMRIVTINKSRPDSLDELYAWYLALSPKDAKFISTEGFRLSPHVNTSIPHKCDKCGQLFEHALDFSTEFFR